MATTSTTEPASKPSLASELSPSALATKLRALVHRHADGKAVA